MKANHYSSGEAKPPLRSLPATPSVSAQAQAAKKKALPVKKLLELERARHEVLGGTSGAKAAANSARDIMESGKLFCERCEDRIPLDQFIGHIQACVGKPRFMSPPPVKHEPTESGQETSDKGQTETDKKPDGGNSSILGSLEQLVKGQSFQNPRQQRQGGGPSPPTTAASSILNPAMAKFSIQSMFPKQEEMLVPPTSPGNSSRSSKPTSPSSSRPSSAGQPSLERGSDCVGETNGKVKPTARGTPSPGSQAFSAWASPKSETSQEEGNKTANPLAALSALCESQKKSPKVDSSRPPNDPGAMLAFSWACNQNVVKKVGDLRSLVSKEGGGVGGGPTLPAGVTPPAVSGASLAAGGIQPASTHSPSPPPPDAKEIETLQSKYQKYVKLSLSLSSNQK